MARSALSALVAVASFSYVAGQATLSTFPATPIASLHFAYPSQVPYKVVPDQYARGTQFGYNICNSTTENQQSLCQTAFVNGIDDFCILAPSQPNSTIGDTEGEEVIWCTKKGHGGRLIPDGTITGIQVLRNTNYVQLFAFLNQANIDISPPDFGGELDPHGQDLLGNPIGGLLYSTAFSSDNKTIQQINEWNMFVGGNTSAIKVCNPAGPNPAGFCQHTLDRIGWQYNMPNSAVNGVFEVCDSDAMDIPGVYTVNGQTLSYSQPPESLGPISTLPYTARIPASSNCVTFQSSALYTDLASISAPTPTGTSSGSTPTASGKGTAGTGTGTRSSSASTASSTGKSNGAGTLTASLFSSIVGVAFSIAFIA
ncbi:hypothetical protein B0F90DRAFT_1952632 [Multifurca ochricompacta]|uniref:Macrofage activating glycoprotein n=1 Tax=Multifurca ochricompacta TaxID=376703 RepID=A0AAD4M132_9AGAM|nr:hypothetical protein B0F90DRAFT_1952632 [Multifurca ochricompacta]